MLGRIYAMMNGLQMRDICKQIYSNIHLFECVCFFPTHSVHHYRYREYGLFSRFHSIFSFLLDTGELDTAKGLSFINSESNNIQLGRTV